MQLWRGKWSYRGCPKKWQIRRFAYVSATYELSGVSFAYANLPILMRLGAVAVSWSLVTAPEIRGRADDDGTERVNFTMRAS